MSNNAVIIVAGGSGKRFGTGLPKQFLELNGLPVIMHTIQAFHRFDPEIEIILVLPEAHFDFWQELKLKHDFTIAHQVVGGGAERFYSVKNGLMAVTVDGIVGIHDALRPLVSEATLVNCFAAAREFGNAIPVVAPADSIRKLTAASSEQVNRNEYRLVQTPQCFRKQDILKAFEQDYSVVFTDDASVAEAAGQEIFLVEGNRENIKITTPEDLIIAKALSNREHN